MAIPFWKQSMHCWQPDKSNQLKLVIFFCQMRFLRQMTFFYVWDLTITSVNISIVNDSSFLNEKFQLLQSLYSAALYFQKRFYHVFTFELKF